jgi:hypothetical protein
VPLLRLPLDWKLPTPPPAIATVRVAENNLADTRVEFDWAREAARQTGIVVHRWLRQVARNGLDQWTTEHVFAQRERIERDAAGLGFGRSECVALAERVVVAVQTMLQDPRGRWIFDPRHHLAHSEYALTGAVGGSLAHYALDRTFVDADGTRWIIDFKLSTHQGGDVDGFLARERERYRPQLESYAEVMRSLDARPIKLGLYFPLLAGWREWPYEG